MTPMMVLFLAGARIEVNAASMFISIVKSVLLPVLLGFILNTLFGKKEAFKEAQQVMPGISVIGLALIVGGVIALQGANFFKSGAVIFIAVLLHNSLGYALGYGVGKLTGMNTAKKRTISIEVGMQNAGLATNLATALCCGTSGGYGQCCILCMALNFRNYFGRNLFTKR